MFIIGLVVVLVEKIHVAFKAIEMQKLDREKIVNDQINKTSKPKSNNPIYPTSQFLLREQHKDCK